MKAFIKDLFVLGLGFCVLVLPILLVLGIAATAVHFIMKFW